MPGKTTHEEILHTHCSLLLLMHFVLVRKLLQATNRKSYSMSQVPEVGA